jgi:hypothetical protein
MLGPGVDFIPQERRAPAVAGFLRGGSKLRLCGFKSISTCEFSGWTHYIDQPMEFQVFENLDLRTWWESRWQNSWSVTCALANWWRKIFELSYVRLLFADHTGNTLELQCKQTHDSDRTCIFLIFGLFNCLKSYFFGFIFLCLYVQFIVHCPVWIIFDIFSWNVLVIHSIKHSQGLNQQIGKQIQSK